MIATLLSIYGALVLIHMLISALRIPANKWTEALRGLVEPGFGLTRSLLRRYLPQLAGKGIDWSPVVLYVALRLIVRVLGWLNWIPILGWIL